MVDFSSRQLLAAGLLFLVLGALMPSGDPAHVLAFLVISLLLSFPAYQWYRKTFVRPIVVWDIHGVFITGDLELENLYEVQGTRDLMKRIRKNYYAVALTNFNPELFGFYSKKWSWFELYDELYNSGGLKARKPSAEAFERFFRASGILKEDVLFLDDRAENVEAAKKLGIKSIQFKDASQAEKTLNEFGVFTR